MALWLLCCVLLFITSRGYDWLSHQSWFWAPELSLPWLLLSGIGLAIASNRRIWPWPHWGTRADQPSSSATAVAPAQSGANQAIAATSGSPSIDENAMKSTRRSAATRAQTSSISFKIAAEKAPTDG